MNCTRFCLVLVATGVVAAQFASADETQPADLVLRNGVIVTVDADRPTVQALAARGGRIIAVGSAADVGMLIGLGTRVIDLAGRLAIPGFIEGHGHLLSLGEARMSLDLSRARSWTEVVRLVAQKAKQTAPGEWI